MSRDVGVFEGSGDKFMGEGVVTTCHHPICDLLFHNLEQIVFARFSTKEA